MTIIEPARPVPSWTPSAGKALVLRTCAPDMTSHGGYVWPDVGGTAVAHDWDPEPVCGFGLHGLLWGAGKVGLLHSQDDASWLVVEVNQAGVVDLDGKVKFPSALVVHVGTRSECVELIQAHAPIGTLVVHGTATAGYRGTATAGDRGTATAGHRGTATAGDEGTATAGYHGTATAGDRGTATAGDDGTATAGDHGTVVIAYWSIVQKCYRKAFGEVGINGILPGVAYRVEDGHLVPVSVTS
jgi:hypothetical protein